MDPLDMFEQSRVIYGCDCDVRGKLYVGEAGRSLGERVEEYTKSLARGDEKSALSQHQVKSGHRMDIKHLMDHITVQD